MLNNYIDNLKDEIIKKTQELIQIPSVNTVSSNPLHPFGEDINDALEYMLDLGNKLGFKTKNIDGYCGYIEFGEGDDLIGIIGHLDVVPEGENWTFPPFSGTIFNHKIYGRGAIDDKGPVIASLYAMKAVSDNLKVNKRVRLILGLNEEKNWKCINYYKEHEEMPNIGFSPDADFPCIYAEKSIITSYLEMDYSKKDRNLFIKHIECNNAINVVPKICSCIIQINSDNIYMSDFIKDIKSILNNYDYEIDIYMLNDEEVKLTSHGVQAHSAHPDLGINAISRLLIILNQIFNKYNCSIELFNFFDKYINTQYNGENLEINVEDETGNLTLNVGKLDLQNDIISIGLNIRIPIETSIDEIESKISKKIKKYSNISFFTTNHNPSLYIPKDNPLVQTLCQIYNEETNTNFEPIAIGGATFARAFNNCISFGANLVGQKDMCHQTDEFISIDNLIIACKIYARAIKTLIENNKSGHY